MDQFKTGFELNDIEEKNKKQDKKISKNYLLLIIVFFSLGVFFGLLLNNKDVKPTEEIIKEAIEKTEEEVDFALLDWKGLGKAEQRDEIIRNLDKLYIRYKKTSEIEK